MSQFERRLARVEEARSVAELPLGVVVVPAGVKDLDAFVLDRLADMPSGGVVVIPAKSSIR